MEKKIRQVIRSKYLDKDVAELYEYGLETFGELFANIFLEELKHSINALSYQYHLHSECKHLETKTQIYRNIILGKYLIIYRIKAEKNRSIKSFTRQSKP